MEGASKLDKLLNAARGRGRGRGSFSERGGRGRGRAMERGRGRGRGAWSDRGRASSDRGLFRGNSREKPFILNSSSSLGHQEQETEAAKAEVCTIDEPSSPTPSSSSSSSSSSSPPPQSDILSRTSLVLSSNPLPPIEALISTLSKFIALRKIDLCNVPKSIDWPNGLNQLSWLGKAAEISKKQIRKNNKGKEKEKAAEKEEEEGEAFGDALTTLNVSGNDLGSKGQETWKGMDGFQELFVLNASHCSLSQLPLSLLSLTSLRALVLSHNSLSNLPSIFPLLPNLNTLILSHNSIEKIPKSLPASLPALKKLGLSFNKLSYKIKTSSNSKSKSKDKDKEVEDSEWVDEDSEWVDFTMCSSLREVRLNSNSQIEFLPKSVLTWGKGLDLKALGLEILDLGDCGLRDWKSLEGLVVEKAGGESKGPEKEKDHSDEKDRESEEDEEQQNTEKKGTITPTQNKKFKKRGLAHLNLRGNGVAELAGYKEKILSSHPSLRVLDNQRLSEKVPSRQEARAAIQAARKERREQEKMARKLEIQKEMEGGEESKERSAKAWGKRRREVDDEEGDVTMKSKETSKDKSKKNKNAKGKDQEEGANLARIRARAGPPPPGDSDEDEIVDEPLMGVESDDEGLQAGEPQKENAGDEEKNIKKRGLKGKRAKDAWMRGGENVMFEEDVVNGIKDDGEETKEGKGKAEGKKRKRDDKAQGLQKAHENSQAKKSKTDQDGNLNSKRKGEGDSRSKVPKKKKVKGAWDEGSEIVKPSIPEPQMQVDNAQQSKDVDEPSKPLEQKANSSVAGVVNVKRKTNGNKVGQKPFKAITAASSLLGTGEIGGEGDAWGGGSAWD